MRRNFPFSSDVKIFSLVFVLFVLRIYLENGCEKTTTMNAILGLLSALSCRWNLRRAVCGDDLQFPDEENSFWVASFSHSRETRGAPWRENCERERKIRERRENEHARFPLSRITTPANVSLKFAVFAWNHLLWGSCRTHLAIFLAAKTLIKIQMWRRSFDDSDKISAKLLFSSILFNSFNN